MSSNSETQPQFNPAPGTVPLPNFNNNNSSGMSLPGLLILSNALERHRHYQLYQYQYAIAAEILRCRACTFLPVPVAPGLRPEFAPFLYGPHYRLDPRPPVEPKPRHRYLGLIAMAILSSPEKKLIFRNICKYILDNYPYFRTRDPDWRNSIQRNLSMHDCFIKAGRSSIYKKAYYWTIHPANMDDFTKGDFRRRNAQEKVRRHMGLAVDEDSSPSQPPTVHHSGLHHVPVAHLHGQPHPDTMTLSDGYPDVKRNPEQVLFGRAAAVAAATNHQHLSSQ